MINQQHLDTTDPVVVELESLFLLTSTGTIAKQLDTLNGNTGSGSSDPCANSVSGIFAKADNCGQFYDCSSRQATVDATNPHVVECKYPFLFNEDSKRCEHYSMVKCGSRKELLDGCKWYLSVCVKCG